MEQLNRGAFNVTRFFGERQEGSKYAYDAENIITSSQREISLKYGESPFGPPSEFEHLFKKSIDEGVLLKSMSEYRLSEPEEAIENVKTRFGLGGNADVIFSGGGSDEILERLTFMLHHGNRKRRIFGLPPHFPDIVNYTNRIHAAGKDPQGVIYGPIDAPTRSSITEGLAIAKERRKKNSSQQNITYYISNPGNPLGNTTSLNAIEDFVDFCADRKNPDFVIIDEAFGDVLPDEESAINLIEEKGNLSVIRSYSKTLGLPGERIGYMATNKNIGDHYRTFRRPFDISASQKAAANIISNPEIIDSHLKIVRPKIKALKSEFIDELKKNDIEILPTDNRVPIFCIRGKDSNLYENLRKLNLHTVPGHGFYSTNKEFTNQVVRLNLPKTKQDLEESVKRISFAYHYDIGTLT